MKKISKKEWFLLSFIFIFFLLLFLFIPHTADDWGNYLVGKEGIVNDFQNAIMMYQTWEGRFISRILINFFTYHKILYSFVCSFLLTLFFFFLANFKKTNHKFLIYFISILFFLCLENTMWTQSFLWTAGSITYLFPTILVIGYFFFYFHIIQKKEKLCWYHYLMTSLFSLLITMFVENIAFTYVVLNFILLIYQFYKTKKIDKYLLFSFCFSTLGAIAMLLSPGSRARLLVDESNFQKLSFLSKIKVNSSQFISYTFLFNISLLIVIWISFIYLVHFLSKKYLRVPLYTILSITFSFLIVAVFCRQMNFSSLLWNFLEKHLLFFGILLFLLGVLFLYLIFKYISKEKKLAFFFFLFAGLSSNLIMLISPVWGGRTTLFTVIVLFFTFLYFIFDFIKDIRPIWYKVFGITSFSLMIVFLICYFNLFLFIKEREKFIKMQLKEEKNPIIVYKVNDLLLWGANPIDTYHVDTFKKYYHIPEKVEIVLQEKKK